MTTLPPASATFSFPHRARAGRRPLALVGFAAVIAMGLLRSGTAQAQSAAPPAAAAKRPNIVFILADDLRKGALSSEGHPFVKTPNIDRIGREGMTFRNAFVTTPVCTPSRASYLTGQYPHTHGVLRNSPYDALSHKLVTFPRLLRDAGYESAYVGKWHMGQDDTPRPGFDHWASFKGQGVYNDPVFNVNGKQTPLTGYTTDVITDQAVAFLQKPHTKPFVLYLAHKAPHGPFTAAPRHASLYKTEPIPLAPSAQDKTDTGKPVVQRALSLPSGPGRGGQPPFREGLVRNQLRLMPALDEGVGRVLKALEDSRQLDNTIIIFTSDHGYFWGEHGLTEKRFAYDEALRVPLLVRYPALVKAGTTSDKTVLSIDIAPTLLALGGAPVPAAVQGRSFATLLTGSAPPDWRTAFLSEFEPAGKEPLPAWQAVRTQEWKYIRYRGVTSMDELYNLKNDPLERKNLISDPGSQSDRKAMESELQKLLRASGGDKPAAPTQTP